MINTMIVLVIVGVIAYVYGRNDKLRENTVRFVRNLIKIIKAKFEKKSGE